MATKVAYTLREDKQGLQKQLGCMNGIFQLFDRRYLLGLHRSRSHKRLTTGQGEKEFTDSSEKAKEKNPKKVTIEKNRASVESSRNSFSSSCSSTTGSSFDCSKRIQSEWQLPSEPTTPTLRRKQFLQPPDIRDVVKDSITREIHVKKDERASPVMKHVDSPRPFIHQKLVQYDSKGRKLAKVINTSSGVEEVKEASRLSCDERESQYSLKSTFKVRELPRLSLDSKQISKRNSMNESRRSIQMKQVQGRAETETSHEPGSNKRPSSGVVARLMGLESLTNSSSEIETSKIAPRLNDHPSLRCSTNGDEYKQNHGSVSPKVYLKIKAASQQQEDSDRVGKKTSVYGEMEKRLSALEFKTSGKDLRALKQILETMQTTRRVLENKEQSLDSQKSDHLSSPTVKMTISPKRRETVTETIMMTGIQNANHMAKTQAKDQSPRIKKSTDRKPRSVSPSNSPEYLTGEKPVSSPRLQRSKNGVNNQCFQPKQSKVQSVVSEVKTRHPKINCINTAQNNEQRDLRQDNKTVSLKSETKIELEVARNDRPKENRRVDKNNFAERLIEDEPAVELSRLTVEQPSPVSVLDAFYVEDTPSPVKNKPYAYNEYETSQVDERETNQVDIYDFANGTDRKLYSKLNQTKEENTNHLVHQIELLTSIDETVEPPYKRTNGDHRYISDILLASGFLKDPDAAIRTLQLHPTANLIKPELFNLLENSKGYTEIMSDECNKNILRSTSYEKIRRKLIFDSVNEILSYKVAMWSKNRCGRLVDGQKLLKELWSEIDNLQSSSDGCLYDEDDEVKNLVSADVNKSLEDWDKCCYEVSGVVLDIERLIFKDLIDEVVNADMSSLHRPRRHRRRLFSM